MVWSDTCLELRDRRPAGHHVIYTQVKIDINHHQAVIVPLMLYLKSHPHTQGHLD